MAKEITLDHLFEDPQYYTKLATVEEYVDDKGVEHVAAALPQTEEEPLKEGIKVGSIIIPYAMDKYGEFVVDKVFKNKDGETSYTGKFKNNGEKREFILHSKDKIVKEEYEESPEETLEGLKEMAMGNLERIADYANMISQRMGEGQNLESWMYSQLTISLENLNTVHDAMDGIDGEKEPVKEGTESDIISQIKDIAKNHQNNTLVDPKTGKKMRVDAFSASAIATVYDALSDSNKEKFLQSGLLGMQAMAMKLLKK
jgi:hypothetical protein